jgi:hypothetical protein
MTTKTVAHESGILAGGARGSAKNRRAALPMVEIGGKPILWHIMKIYWPPHSRLRRVARLQGVHGQGVLRELLPAPVG